MFSFSEIRTFRLRFLLRKSGIVFRSSSALRMTMSSRRTNFFQTLQLTILSGSATSWYQVIFSPLILFTNKILINLNYEILIMKFFVFVTYRWRPQPCASVANKITSKISSPSFRTAWQAERMPWLSSTKVMFQALPKFKNNQHHLIKFMKTNLKFI